MLILIASLHIKIHSCLIFVCVCGLSLRLRGTLKSLYIFEIFELMGFFKLKSNAFDEASTSHISTAATVGYVGL